MLKSRYLLLLSAFFIANSAFSTLAYAESCCPENNTDPYIRVAEKNGNQCSIRECIAGYIEKDGSCKKIEIGDTLDAPCNDHAKTCIYGRDFFAKITECEPGYKPDMFGLTCITPDYEDDSCNPDDEFALSGVMVGDECQSDWCKRGHLKDNNNNKCIPNKCDDGFAYVDTYGCLEISKCGVIEGNTKIFYTSEEDLKISCETNITSPIKSNENALADGCNWEITLDENIVINDIMVKIIDETSKIVITDAIVTTNGIPIATEEGRFSLKEIQDNTEIKISRSGYETKTITAEAIRNLPEENPSTKMRIIYLTEQTKQDNDTPENGTDCTDQSPNSKTATYQNGKCVTTACNDGYYLTDGNCADINGSPCDNLPANATAGKREYNATTKETTCIVTACDKYYIVSDDKKSCEKDPEQEIQELKDKAQAAKDKEQSTENKLLGAVGIGATGIGGMQLASALAEQSADADALTDMTAYLETFKCTYGNNASVSGGTTNIETPGGNSLLSLYTEYVSLANDLKLRKNMLEMPAGIESEAILSSANGNLYNNDTTDKTSGAYASLARALSDPTGADAQKLAQQQTETADKLKTGAIVAGVGAIGSLAGNLIINKDKYFDKDGDYKSVCDYETDSHTNCITYFNNTPLSKKDKDIMSALSIAYLKKVKGHDATCDKSDIHSTNKRAYIKCASTDGKYDWEIKFTINDSLKSADQKKSIFSTVCKIYTGSNASGNTCNTNETQCNEITNTMSAMDYTTTHNSNICELK